MSDALLPTQLQEKINAKALEQDHKPGLYVVATPIGNILDISLRALCVLQRAKCIFAEDTRQSRKLLDWYGIKGRLVACHEYNEADSAVTTCIEMGEVYALITDAGTPAISDPGYKIVNWCINNGITVFPIPGASAPIVAMSASGMPSDRFTFFGFLPSKSHARKSLLENLKNEKGTLIFFESPNRLLDTLKNMFELLGDRSCCICRELTKIHEEFRRGNISDMIAHFSEKKPIGEFVILVAGATAENADKTDISAELKELLQTKTVKEVSKLIAEKYKIAKNEVYKKALEIRRPREKSQNNAS